MTTAEPVDLDAVEARAQRARNWLNDGLPPVDADESKGHRAAWLVVAGDTAALVAEVRALRAQVADAEERWKQWAIDALREPGPADVWIAEHRPKTRGPIPTPMVRHYLADYLESLRGTEGSTDGD